MYIFEHWRDTLVSMRESARALRRSRAEIGKRSNPPAVLSRPFPGHEKLTPRERMVLAHIVRGSTSKEAARALGISPRTVEFHRTNILKKLGAKNIVDAIRKIFVR